MLVCWGSPPEAPGPGLDYIVLYYIIIYYIILYYYLIILLYYIILFYIILYWWARLGDKSKIPPYWSRFGPSGPLCWAPLGIVSIYFTRHQQQIHFHDRSSQIRPENSKRKLSASAVFLPDPASSSQLLPAPASSMVPPAPSSVQLQRMRRSRAASTIRRIL